MMASRSKSIAFVGLSIAIIAICSWITIPLGPIPFTMQMFAIPLMICLLSPKEAIATIYCYVLLGVIGIPVFSGMRGGIGVLLGPTGGFIIGYLIAVPLAVGFLYVVSKGSHRFSSNLSQQTPNNANFANSANNKSAQVADGESGNASDSHSLNQQQTTINASKPSRIKAYGAYIIAGLIFTGVAYLFGTIQFMLVGGVSFEAALISAVIPFIVPDVVKVVLATFCAVLIKSALGYNLPEAFMKKARD